MPPVEKCPVCHADLDGILSSSGEIPTCPFCGSELPSSALADAGESSITTEPNDPTISASSLDPLPSSSKIEIIESDSDHLVLHLPPGGSRSKGIGLFALMWNGFMCLFTPPWFFAMQAGEGPPLYFIVPFLSLFWIIGLGFAYVWLRMKLTRTYLFLDHDRIVLQKTFLGRKSVEEANLNSDSYATLVESYRVNEQPVYRIEVNGDQSSVKFGTRLGKKEKNWIVDAINQVLDRRSGRSPRQVVCPSCGTALSLDPSDPFSQPQRCSSCGAPLPASLTRTNRRLEIPEVTPKDLPADSMIQIEEDDIDFLKFSIPLAPPGKVRLMISIIFQIVGFAFVATTAVSLLGELNDGINGIIGGLSVLFSLLFMLPGIVIFFLGMAIHRARITIQIDREWLTVRWHHGPLGYTKRFATDAIEKVQLLSNLDSFPQSTHPRSQRRRSGDLPLVPTVQVGESFLPLTTFHPREVSQQVAGLVKTRLESLGVRLSDG